MKSIILFTSTFIFAFFVLMNNAQQPTQLPDEAYTLYPTLEEMHGFAYANYGQKTIILGGMIKAGSGEMDPAEYPNTDIILIDYQKNRAAAFSSGSLEGITGEQLAAKGLAFVQKKNTLYLLGGYGYSDTQKQFMTFPYVSVIQVNKLITALETGQDPLPSIQQICDERLAIFDGTLEFNGNEFFLIKGKQALKLNPFDSQPQYYEEDKSEAIRTFRINEKNSELKLENMQEWYDMKDVLDTYQQLLPPLTRQLVEERLSGSALLD